MAAIPFPHGEAVASEVKCAMNELGMPDINISTNVLCLTLKNPQFNPMWEAVDQLEEIFYVHAAGEGCHSPLITEHDL